MKNTPHSSPTIKSLVAHRINDAPFDAVWTPVDFLDLGSRSAVDKTLQRMVTNGDLRRVDRGLYVHPQFNALTGQLAAPDYRRVIDTVGRRDQVRMLIDGMTVANDLGLTHAIPGQVIVRTDGRLRPIQLDNLTIQFKLTTPSKLYWAGRPAMRIVQALYWLRDNIKDDASFGQIAIQAKLIKLLSDADQAGKIRDDLQTGLHTMPSWMQQWVRELLELIPRTQQRQV